MNHTNSLLGKAIRFWERYWMSHSGLNPSGRLACFLASIFSPCYKGRTHLAHLGPQNYISIKAQIYHSQLTLGKNIFIGDRVVIYQSKDGGKVSIGDKTHIHSYVIIETGVGGSLQIGADTHIQPRCQFSAYKGNILLGSGAQIAPNCGFYPYDHGISSENSIKSQKLQSKGDIIIGDDAWLGFGVTVLSNVKIGPGAVIGAGSLVTKDIPDNSVAFGVPAIIRGKRERQI